MHKSDNERILIALKFYHDVQSNTKYHAELGGTFPRIGELKMKPYETLIEEYERKTNYDNI